MMFPMTTVIRAASQLLFAAIAVASLAACAQTQFVHEGAADYAEGDPQVSRTVRVDLKDAFYNKAPACVAVLPTLQGTGTPPEMARFVEQAVARHLSQRLPTVIGPHDLEQAVQRLALDLSDTGDQRRFLRARHCDALVLPELMTANDDYYVIWSNKSVDIRLRLFTPGSSPNGETDELLWIARHATSRGDGSLPLDIASLGIGAFKAGNHNMDKEMHFSLIEDAVRRMMVTLPDTRAVGFSRSANSRQRTTNEPLPQPN